MVEAVAGRWTLPRAHGAVEHGDGALPPAELGPYLDDLERLNAWFGGYALSVRVIERLGAAVPPGHALVVADVGGARGDLAIRLVRRARRQRRPIRVIVVDRDEASLVMGQRAAKPWPEILWVQADATALPLRDRSVDVASMALTLHHLEPEAAVKSLGGMRRLARLGVVVNDLLRTRLAHGLVRVTTRLVTRHPASRHDGPLSVLRAYAPGELREIARASGFSRLAVRTHRALARVVAVGS
jgi:ubiquinone/menaquinone biosynthesis C-methylase UbiE